MSEVLAQLEKKGSSGGATYVAKCYRVVTGTTYTGLSVTYYDSDFFTLSGNDLIVKKSCELSIHFYAPTSYGTAYCYSRGYLNSTQLFEMNSDPTNTYENLNLSVSVGDRLYFQIKSQNNNRVGAYAIIYAH